MTPAGLSPGCARKDICCKTIAERFMRDCLQGQLLKKSTAERKSATTFTPVPTVISGVINILGLKVVALGTYSESCVHVSITAGVSVILLPSNEFNHFILHSIKCVCTVIDGILLLVLHDFEIVAQAPCNPKAHQNPPKEHNHNFYPEKKSQRTVYFYLWY